MSGRKGSEAVQRERLKWHIHPLFISLVCELLGMEMQPFVPLEMSLACQVALEMSADQGMLGGEAIQRSLWALLSCRWGRRAEI